jgi:hypothetical protein
MKKIPEISLVEMGKKMLSNFLHYLGTLHHQAIEHACNSNFKQIYRTFDIVNN